MFGRVTDRIEAEQRQLNQRAAANGKKTTIE